MIKNKNRLEKLKEIGAYKNIKFDNIYHLPKFLNKESIMTLDIKDIDDMTEVQWELFLIKLESWTYSRNKKTLLYSESVV